jgi:hypothetical protein
LTVSLLVSSCVFDVTGTHQGSPFSGPCLRSVTTTLQKVAEKPRPLAHAASPGWCVELLSSLLSSRPSTRANRSILSEAYLSSPAQHPAVTWVLHTCLYTSVARLLHAYLNTSTSYNHHHKHNLQPPRQTQSTATNNISTIYHMHNLPQASIYNHHHRYAERQPATGTNTTS